MATFTMPTESINVVTNNIVVNRIRESKNGIALILSKSVPTIVKDDDGNVTDVSTTDVIVKPLGILIELIAQNNIDFDIAMSDKTNHSVINAAKALRGAIVTITATFHKKGETYKRFDATTDVYTADGYNYDIIINKLTPEAIKRIENI